MQRLGRMKHELSILASTMTGISVWSVEDDLFHLQAQILGGDDSPYESGIFKLEIRIPDRYPFEPPHVKFLTPIYHPNIDTGGRICLDVLKMPPKGNWKPSSNIRTVLLSIQLLMNEPNPDDPLMEDISQQYKSDRRLFRETAATWTRRHAVEVKEEVGERRDVVNRGDGGEETSGKGKEKVEVKEKDDKAAASPAANGASLRIGNSTSTGVASKTTSVDSTTSSNDTLKPACSSDSAPSKSTVSKPTPPTLSSTKASSDPVNFDDSFEDDGDDFISKTPQKKKAPPPQREDSFSDLDDSDLDLFDFEDSPVKKKKKMT